MALGETAQLAVQLNLTGNFNREGTKAIGTIKGMATQTKSLQSQVKSSVLTGVGLGAGLVGFQLLAKGIGLVTDGIQSAVDEEASVAQLTRSIEENSAAWDGNIGAVEAVIKARQALAFTDDEQRDSLRALVAITKDETEALRVQRIAMDFARLKGIDLATATGVLGKVYGGNVGILSRYIGGLRKGITATEALEEVQKRAAGQAEEFADTTGGKAAVAAIKFSEAMESIGRIAVPAVGFLADALGGVADVIDMLTSTGGGSSLDTLITDLEKTAGVFKEAGDAAKESSGDWAATGTAVDSFVDGLNALQNTAADLGFLPNLVKKNEWTAALSDVQEALGKTDDEMLQLIDKAEQLGLTLDQTRASLIGTSVVKGSVKAFKDMGEAMRQAAFGANTLGEEEDDARAATRKLTTVLFDNSEASEAAEGGFRKSRRELNRLINAAENFRAKNERVFPRAVELIQQAERAQREQTQAANRGLPTQVAKWQAVQDSIQGMLNPLRAALALTVKLQAQDILQGGFDAFARSVGGTGKTERRAGGGPVQAWHTYQVNENTPEYLTMGGRGGWISPRGPVQTSKRDVLDVRVQPIITAFQVGRELGRAATTRRSGAGVL